MTAPSPRYTPNIATREGHLLPSSWRVLRIRLPLRVRMLYMGGRIMPVVMLRFWGRAYTPAAAAAWVQAQILSEVVAPLVAQVQGCFQAHHLHGERSILLADASAGQVRKRSNSTCSPLFSV